MEEAIWDWEADRLAALAVPDFSDPQAIEDILAAMKIRQAAGPFTWHVQEDPVPGIVITLAEPSATYRTQQFMEACAPLFLELVESAQAFHYTFSEGASGSLEVFSANSKGVMDFSGLYAAAQRHALLPSPLFCPRFTVTEALSPTPGFVYYDTANVIFYGDRFSVALNNEPNPFDGSGGLGLPALHSFPVQKAIAVVEEKHHKANHHGDIAPVLQAGQNPKNDKNHIIESIGQGIKGTSPEGKIYGDKTCCHGKGAGGKIGGIEGRQNEIEPNGHPHRQKPQNREFSSADPVYLHLRSSPLIGMSQPGDQREDRHGQGHAEIGDHLPIVRKGIGDESIQQAEENHQALPQGIPLCTEDQSRRPDQGRQQRRNVPPVKQEKGQKDRPGGASP